MFPPTQAFQHIIPKGEVFWDFEASPQTREALRKRLDESSPDVPKTVKSPIKPLSPSLKIRTRQKRPTGSLELDSESKKLVDDMKQFCDQVIHSDSNTVDKPPQKAEDENVFDSDEDSFLLRCTQAVENNECQTPTMVKPKKSADMNLDELDDEFNLFLSQLKTPSRSPKLVALKDLKSTAVAEPPKPILRPSENSSFKKFKSEDNITLNGGSGGSNQKSRPRNASGNIMKGWQRSNSSPEATKKRCSKEEIELKKQAALQRRQQRSQSMKK